MGNALPETTLNLDQASPEEVLRVLRQAAVSHTTVRLMERQQEVARVVPSAVAAAGPASQESLSKRERDILAVRRTAGMFKRYQLNRPASIEEETAAAEEAIARDVVQRMGDS